MPDKTLQFIRTYILREIGNFHVPILSLKHTIDCCFPFVAFDCTYSDSVVQVLLVANDSSTQATRSRERGFDGFMNAGRKDRV